MKRLLGWLALAVCGAALLTAGGIWGATAYYTSQRGAGCASCHEMAEYVGGAHSSPHRNLDCQECHEDTMAAKLRHIRAHLTRRVPDAIRLRDVDVLAITASCQKCHRQEYAAWHAGPHSATYQQIFADPKQNTQRRLMDDCFRCHGMHYDGAVRDLVQPQDTRGPWRITRSGFADQPTMPCSACHWIHGEGSPQIKPAERISVAGAPLDNSLGFFDRRERLHFSAAALSIPPVYDGATLVKVSPDQRQAICYQCHAPRLPDAGTPAALHGWGAQAGSADDRTPMGVHEGLSCFACHGGHNENARASCKTCHSAMSDCGQDVEKMDTTYASASSKHNIHFVRCTDCHTHGVPQTKRSAPAHSAASIEEGAAKIRGQQRSAAAQDK